MPLKAIIFDVDGTLGETEPIHREAFNAAFRAFGLEWNWSENEYREFADVPGGRERLRRYVESCRPEFQERFEAEDLYARIHRQKTWKFGQYLESSGTSLRPGVGRLITDARSAGLLLGACTVSQRETFEILIINALGFEAISWFKGIVSAKDVVERKPHPEGYSKLLQKLRVSADEAVVIEDSPIGAQAAQAAGIRVIAVPSEASRGRAFGAGPEIVLSDLGEPGMPFEVLEGDPKGFSYASIRSIRAWLGESAEA